MSNKRKTSLIRRLIIALCSIAVIFALLLLGIFCADRIAFSAFYKNARRQFAIPGISDGFVGQGLDYLEEQDAFLTCGYSAKKGKASAVYLIDGGGKAERTLLKNADGSDYTGHTGGIAHHAGYVYITGDDGCDVFALSDFLEKKGESAMLGTVKTPFDPAYCKVREGKLYVGSFYRKGNYETPDWQRITTPDGTENKSVIAVYEIDDGATDNFKISPKPCALYSAGELVQGMTFTDGEIVLSASYALAPSRLRFYDNSRIAAGQFELEGEKIPLYYLDGACLSREVTAPPMSEEIVYRDGMIYIMTESASNKYVFGKFTGATHLYAYKV